jgi:hypothetical protein
VHYLYVQAGLLKQRNGRMYDLRVHSLRKYFKTQLLALGVQPDYVDYMMGHTIDTYHDIQSLGIDKLRNVYASSGLAIRGKTQVSKLEALKEIIRAWGLNPEEILTRDALTRPNMTIIDQNQLENHQLSQLTTALRQQMLKEIRENQSEKSMNSHLGLSSPGEIRTLVVGFKDRCTPAENTKLYVFSCTLVYQIR